MHGSNNLERMVIVVEVNDMDRNLHERLRILTEDLREDQSLLMAVSKQFGEDTTNEEMTEDLKFLLEN